MKKTHILLTWCIVCFIALVFQSCGEEKYTVWTDTSTYAEFVASANTTLGDGNYIKVEIGKDTWAEVAKDLPAEDRHRWDEATIKKWFISYGFGQTEATRESSWITIVDHGMVVVRNGNIVNMIVK